MILKDYHIHTNYCDGCNSPEEIVLSAIKRGMVEIGFSGHSYVPFDLDYCMNIEETQRYISEINLLKEKYRDKISILCGIEMDYYSDQDPGVFDYRIGSVHYFKFGDKFYPIDASPETFVNVVNDCFNGDFYSASEKYFELVSDIVLKTNADIIGHFDLISKFNEKHSFFDVSNKRYKDAWKSAVNNLLRYNKPFEINTGAISRGYRTAPYPSNNIIDYIRDNGGRFILSSDAHCAENICYKFSEYENLL